MKILYKISFILLTTVLLASCKVDEPIPVNPDFKVSLPLNSDGSYTAVVGQPFFVTLTGSGQFLTLFEGTEGRVYGEPNAKGIDFDTKDSLDVRYGAAGSYQLTVLSSSASNYGEDISRNAKTVTIHAVDKRNAFTSFSVTSPDGLTTYTGDIGRDSIILKVPESITDFNFKPIFTLNSSLAKVYVNNVEQTSGTTSNNFAQPVEYVVKSSQGDEKKYIVRFYTYPLSSENKLLLFELQPRSSSYVLSNGEKGVIDQQAKTITLAINYGTSTSGMVRYNIESSSNSTIYLNNSIEYTPFRARQGFRLDILETITIKAQNGTNNTYSLIKTNQDPFISFTFKGLTPQPTGIIDNVNKTIKISVLQGTPVSNLIAEWVGTNGKVTINGVDQENGVTANDFTSPVVYQIYKGSTLAESYTVSVNVIQ